MLELTTPLDYCTQAPRDLDEAEAVCVILLCPIEREKQSVKSPIAHGEEAEVDGLIIKSFRRVEG